VVPAARREKHCRFIYTCNVTPTLQTDRAQAIDEVAASLLPRASLATRLLLRQTRRRVSRSEAGMLSALSAGPRRITELAELEGLAQPTTTLLVKRMQERGWVARERDDDDGRVVLVSLTEAGVTVLEELRADYRGALRDLLLAMSDDEVAALMTATTALQALIEALQQWDAR
jgi:DNA-binding MarR family transcriptional regulator